MLRKPYPTHLTYSTIVRIFRQINIQPTGCWNWIGETSAGYGRISICHKHFLVHRLIFSWAVGISDLRLTIDHLCRNKLCCNPVHLELVPTRENVLRGTGPSAQNARKVVCSKGHALVQGKVQRTCPTCQHERYLERSTPEYRARQYALQKRRLSDPQKKAARSEQAKLRLRAKKLADPDYAANLRAKMRAYYYAKRDASI